MSEYQSLAPIQGVTDNVSPDNLDLYLNGIFKMGIGIAIALAILMIVIGGIQYLSTDAVSGKTDGRERIKQALFGLLIALLAVLVLDTINPQLLSTKLEITKPANLDGQAPTQSQVQQAYNRVYAQWTDADDEALHRGDRNAMNKWNGIQSQIDALNKVSPLPPAENANVGTANKKVLDKIASGFQCTDTNCFESAVNLYRSAGVSENSVFQNSSYIVGGRTLSSFGTARLPVPGEMVDMYTGYDRSDPFHTVIVNSIDSNGSAVVWDWRNNITTGLRKVDLNLNSPGTKGYIGRIYTPTE
jgi:hypothetical protein